MCSIGLITSYFAASLHLQVFRTLASDLWRTFAWRSPRILPTTCFRHLPVLDFVPDLVDASERTDIDTSANAYDARVSTIGGCDPGGCAPEFSRDSVIAPESRWSCKYDLEGKPCNLWFRFKEPQDIVELQVAFYKGNERKRAFSVVTFNNSDESGVIYQFTSHGDSLGFENFAINTDETYELYITPAEPNYDDWLSITEVWRVHFRQILGFTGVASGRSIVCASK